VSEEACPGCHGSRLNAQARAVRFDDTAISAIAALSVRDVRGWVERLQQRDVLSVREQGIARDLVPEIRSRLEFLEEVGLGYLTLDRGAPTLSGGEAQRIRLAAQLGSNLQGVCYVLDEPTIGLHARDNQILLDALHKLGDKGNTLVVVEHDDDESLAAARARIAAGRALGTAIETPAAGYSEMLVALAVDLGRDDNKALPIALTQVALHANPGNREATILLALLFDGDGRPDSALALLRAVPADDLLAGEALDLETRLLGDKGDEQAALRRAQEAAASPNAGPQDFARMGNVLGDMDRHAEAAAAYGEAIARSKKGGSDSLWTLYLFRAASLEQANRWNEAKADLETAMKLEPENPLLLNFLGYGKLERGEDLDAAEAMIRKASSLRPDDASITDSLGWALYKRGRLPEAITTLTKAAAGDPSQSEIHEHLGDALYSSGRRIEARFSWQAALITAEAKAKTRLEAKLESGLTPATAAP